MAAVAAAPRAVKSGFIPSMEGGAPSDKEIEALNGVTGLAMAAQSAMLHQNVAERAETVARIIPQFIDREMGIKYRSDAFFKLIFTDARHLIYMARVAVDYLDIGAPAGLKMMDYLEQIMPVARSQVIENANLTATVCFSLGEMPPLFTSLFEDSVTAPASAPRSLDATERKSASQDSERASPAPTAAPALATASTPVSSGLPTHAQLERLEKRLVELSQSNLASAGKPLAMITAECLHITAQILRTSKDLEGFLSLSVDGLVIEHKAIASWLRLGQHGGSLENFVNLVASQSKEPDGTHGGFDHEFHPRGSVSLISEGFF